MTDSPIAKCWTFVSSNGRTHYQTLLYRDGSTSCNCPGWTRRTAPDGSRSCRHTRSVDMGIADSEAISSHDYGKLTNRNPGTTVTIPRIGVRRIVTD